MTTAEARAYVARHYLVEDVTSKRDRREGWAYVVHIPGTAERMTTAGLIEFARNLRYFG
jgi:hypothetical protein